MSDLVQAGQLLNTARSLVISMEQNFMQDALKLGDTLKAIRDTRAWTDGYESFDNPDKHNFLDDIGLAKQLANKLILLHERFVLQGVSTQKLLQTSWSRLAEALPYAKDADPDRLDELLDFALAAPTKDEFRQTLKERYRAEPSELTCEHNETFTLSVCRTCNHKWRI